MPRKLNDMQLILLATACQREDGSLLPPPATLGDQGARIRKNVAALLKRGLAAEADVGDATHAWREDGDRHIGVVITAAGRAVVAQEEHQEDVTPSIIELGVPIEESAMDTSAESSEPAQIAPSEEPVPSLALSPPRTDTKKARVLALLHREQGASLDELVAETDWLPHTTRAALTGLRKKGHAVLTEKVEGRSRYRIEGGA